MKKLIFKLSVGITPLALIGLGSFGLAVSGAKPNNLKPINQVGEMNSQGQSNLLEKARRWRNSNFTSLSIDGTNPGALVLTGSKSISRIDLYGNVIWTFDPGNTNDLTGKVGFYDANNRLTAFSGDVPFNVSDLSSKTVVEATQDQEDPNVFYLLLIPDAAVQQEQKTKDQVFENYFMSDAPAAGDASVQAGGDASSSGGAGTGGGAAGGSAGAPAAASSTARLVEEGNGAGMGTMTPATSTSETVIDYNSDQNKIPKPKTLLDSSESSESINDGRTYANINTQKNLQGVIVKVNENLFNSENPFAVENMAFIKPKDMVDNYPSTWTQPTVNNKMTNVLQFYKHDNPNAVNNRFYRAKYYPKRLETQTTTPLIDSSFSPYEHPEWYEGNQFVMPWMQYITNLGGLYAKDGMVYLFGGNGTWVNNESALSIGVFRTKFENRTAETSGNTKTVGYPYGILLSAISFDATRNGLALAPASLGQDVGYHFVPRLAVGGVSSPRGANGNIFLGSAITWGTNGGNFLDTKWHSPAVIEDAPTAFITVNSSGAVVNNSGSSSTPTANPTMAMNGNENIPYRWTNSYDYNSVRFAALISKPAGGNTKQVESLFTTALKLDTLNSLPDKFTQENNIFFSYAMLDGRQWSLGTRKDSTWLTTNTINNFTYNTQQQLASTAAGENANPRNILNALTTAKGFDRRDIGNVVYTYSNNTNKFTYYYQVGGAITTWPEVQVNYKTSANITYYNLTRTDFGSVRSETQDANTVSSKLNGAYLSSTGDSGWYNGSIYVKQANFTPSSQGYTWQDFKGLTTTASNAVISNWTKAGYSIRPDDDTVFNVSKIPFEKEITAAVNVRSLDSYYVQLNGETSVNTVARVSPDSSALALNPNRITNPLMNRDNVIGQGAFISRNDIPSSFFENKINDIVTTEADGKEVLDSKYINSIYRYTPPQNNPDIRLRLLVIDRSRATNDFIKLLPQVLVDGEYVAVPQANSVFVSDQEFTGFDALPGYVLPVAISIPIIIIALALALGLGIGIPMSQNRKMLKQGFAISNKKVDILTTAVGSVFKQIINRTSVTNIKKTPQMLQANKKDGASQPSKPSAPAAKKPAGPTKPSAPGAKPTAPAKPKAPAPTKKIE
ncbi:adhesin P1 [Mycoplasmoides gallisepticum]|uniref:adhesin P1 n=1 Tax=Mycoplasmoides gallisepticum TaxID=2096 RepID=UPI0037045FE8